MILGGSDCCLGLDFKMLTLNLFSQHVGAMEFPWLAVEAAPKMVPFLRNVVCRLGLHFGPKMATKIWPGLHQKQDQTLEAKIERVGALNGFHNQGFHYQAQK